MESNGGVLRKSHETAATFFGRKKKKKKLTMAHGGDRGPRKYPGLDGRKSWMRQFRCDREGDDPTYGSLPTFWGSCNQLRVRVQFQDPARGIVQTIEPDDGASYYVFLDKPRSAIGSADSLAAHAPTSRDAILAMLETRHGIATKTCSPSANLEHVVANISGVNRFYVDWAHAPEERHEDGHD